MTESLVRYLESYGYWTALAAGFAEYVGVPLATVPLLIAAGGMSAAAGLNPLAAAGGWRTVRIALHRSKHAERRAEEAREP